MRPRRTVVVGESLPERQIGPITQTDIVRFAGAGGDFNPLHHDPAFAEKAGFDGVIAMGQLQAGMIAGWLTDWCGVEHLRELDVRFLRPVRLGAVLRFTGEITSLTTLDDQPAAKVAMCAAADTVEVVRAPNQPSAT
ncbi:MAG: MaoC family dehydratase N-terminal domain-containing protein [Actinomycetia bacterium]|nr:MaoC family dehydratase N-terminal domain-containing protein [Actinomycetes bacterium]